MKIKIIIFALLIVLVTVLGYVFVNPDSNNSIELNADNARLENNLVCMVNNAYMGKEQIPIKVGDKIYYGCCEMCEANLKNNPEFRSAKDPLTGELVDKADAFIVLNPNNSDQVLYFKNKDNYISYNKQQVKN